jgi:hypothetical protein
MPHTTVHKILQKCLKFKSYKYQLLQHATAQDKEVCHTFCYDFLSRHEDDKLLAAKIVFSDEATFHLLGNINAHNLGIWGSNNPHEVIEHTRDSPKLNVFCALAKQNVFGPFFFAKHTVTGIMYLDMLEEIFMPILEEKSSDDILFQQDRVPPHFHK